MQTVLRSFRNVIYKFRGIQEVSDSKDFIFYKCLKCGNELKGNKHYGKLRILCTCGHMADVYTGENTHFKNDKDKSKEDRLHTKDYIHRTDEYRRIEIFDKYLNSDLTFLCNIINNKRDITKQVECKICTDLLKGVNNKEGYENITKYLQKFCDLESVPLNIVWDQLDNQNTLSSTEKENNIIGTTYYLPLQPLMFYTVYLNPKFISSNELLIATIAHELSHIYASHNNIHFKSPDNERGNKAYSEQMTDLLSVVLGMGDLMCTSIDRREFFDTGYLTNDMICKSYNLWKSEYLSGNRGEINTLIICEQCSQKLKVPISKKKLNLVCPKCKKAFTYKSF